MKQRTFKNFLEQKDKSNDNWKKQFIQLEKGFVPPSKMRPIIQAFLNSSDVKLIDDTSKDITLPKKSLFLCGGSVRDFLKNKSPHEYHLATNATPAQIALILHSAGFKQIGKTPEKLKITFKPKETKENKTKTWEVGSQDNKGNIYSIIATYRNESFEISTLRKDPKTEEGSAKEFVDNPNDDAAGRDLTINALYIELSKPDGENNKLYDPTEKGWHDVKHDMVRSVGNAKDNFKEDKSRILRAIRFHSRFGKGNKLDADIEKAVEEFKDLSGVNLETIRDEFLKGLLHADTDVKRYVNLYKKTGIIKKLFPNLEIRTDIPSDFEAHRDKSLALAWILQDNPIENVSDALASTNEKEEKTGWNQQEKKAILFLLFLKEFTPEMRPEFLRSLKGTGLTKAQIKNWVDMFNIDDKGVKRNQRPQWAIHVKTFADNDSPLAGPLDVEHLPVFIRQQALDDLEIDNFNKLF